ncbi:hypothetical protein PSH66_00030 [Pseudomonas sp. FP597]|uniref:hypothetical protein n=1 Tax=Pseudomonas sp. FP597 TaxID=2954096 RepID=UPI00273367C6|nr:hypothetical protein [Pseudomonas sp. FP597]WLI06757.1 hypothetical protein PSH66_00030 [Pseudomonas sp. FP597]
MVDIVEGGLTFSFGTGWQAIKYDDTVWYVNHMKRSIKAMDILACKQKKHWWIEIKDCDGFETANMPRMSPTDHPGIELTKTWIKTQAFADSVKAQRKKMFIVDEVMQKFRDTLTSAVVAQRLQNAELLPFIAPSHNNEPLVIVLILTWGLPDYARLAARLQQKLNTALVPYGLTGFVVNETCQVAGLDPVIT